MEKRLRFGDAPRPANLNTDDFVLPPGEVIDRKYEIISKIGQGGMGVVYKARSISMGREVAIKMLTHIDEETLRRFKREAVTLAKIKHRAIVQAHDVGDAGKYGPYLVLAYVPGRPLDVVAKSSLSIRESVDLTLAICSGVSACHVGSVIHRDLKPSNIIVTNEIPWQERVKILDFGLALPFDSPILAAHQMRITNVGQVAGTPRYIAPELLRHEEPTPQCDQYAIASLLYLLVTGRAPFHDSEGEQLASAILRGEYVPLGVLRPDTSLDLRATVSRGLHLDPNKRFDSVNQFALALVGEASQKLQNSFTRYFLEAMRPVDRRLIEPVSGYRAAEVPQRRASDPVVAIISEPMVDPSVFPQILPSLTQQVTAPLANSPPPAQPSLAPAFSPSPAEPRPSRPSAPPLSPPPSDDDRLPAEPEVEVSTSSHGRRLAPETRVMFVFACGACFGVLLSVAAIIAFVHYQPRSSFCPPAPGQPAVVLPRSGGNAPK